MMGVSGEFRFLLEQKEREIIGLCEQQMQTIHQQISEKDKEFVELAARFAQLEEDFKYNLALLDERDVELANYDQTCASFKTLASEREVLLKEAKESLANLQYERFKEKEKSEEMEGSYLKKINSLQKQMEHLQLTHEAQHLKISQAFEATKVELTHQLSEKQEQLNLRCEELGAQYLERLNAQTIQTQLQMEDLKVNFLLAEGHTKELEMELEKVLSKHDQINEIDLKWRMCIDGKEKLIRSISMELSQLQIEKDSLKLKYDHEVKSMNEKLKELEAEHEGQISSLRKQVEACKSKLDVSEARFSSYESLKTEQIFSYDQKIRKLEREAADKDVQLWTKIEEIEVHAQHFGQKELSSAIEREKILQEELLKRIDPTIKNQDQKWRIHIPLEGSINSSLPAASPLPSPIASNQYGTTCSSQPDDPTKFGEEQKKGAQFKDLELENRHLQGVIQDLQEQNERIRNVVGMKVAIIVT